jgi:hypothetical protein
MTQPAAPPATLSDVKTSLDLATTFLQQNKRKEGVELIALAVIQLHELVERLATLTGQRAALDPGAPQTT